MFRTWNDTIRMPVECDDEEDSDTNDVFCDLCGEDGPWSNEAEAENHRRKKHKTTLLSLLRESSTEKMCSSCLHIQPSKKDLLAHISANHLLSSETSHTEHKTYICDYCNKLFFNKIILTTHIWHFHINASVRKKNMYIECPKCTKNIRLSNAAFHFLHQGILTVTNCPICLKNIKKQKYFLEHIKSHNPYYHCDICGYDTKKASYFNNHMLKHKNNKNASSITNISRYFCASRHKLLWGLRFTNVFRGISIPLGVEICVLCRAIFDASDVARMSDHIQVEHSPLEVVAPTGYRCVCGEIFSNKILLKQHIFQLKGEHKEESTKNDANEENEINKSNDIMTLEQILMSAANDVCFEIEVAEVLSGSSICDQDFVTSTEQDLNSESTQDNSNVQLNSESEKEMSAKSIIDNFSMES